VPRLLTIGQKTKSNDYLKVLFGKRPKDFLRRFVIVMKHGSIIHTKDKKNSQNNGHQRRQKQFHQLRSWQLFNFDTHGILLIDYLEKGKTITGEYYTLFLDQQNTSKKNAKKKYFFIMTTYHMSAVSIVKLYELRF